MGLGGLWERLERLDRRVLGRHADPGPPPRRPVRAALLLVGFTAAIQFFGLLIFGLSLAEAVGALLTYLVTVVIGLPLALWAAGRLLARDGQDGGPTP